jgi:hypothetical protein
MSRILWNAVQASPVVFGAFFLTGLMKHCDLRFAAALRYRLSNAMVVLRDIPTGLSGVTGQ